MRVIKQKTAKLCGFTKDMIKYTMPVCRCVGVCAFLRVKSVYKEEIKGGLSQLNYLT